MFTYKSSAAKLFQIFALVTAAAFPSIALGECLKDGQKTSLSGTLQRVTYPGRPNFESIDRGDEPVTVFVIVPNAAPCVVAVSMEDDSSLIDLGTVARFQLVLSSQQYREYAKWVGSPVRITGTVFQGITAHHYTRALVEVSSMSAGPAPQPLQHSGSIVQYPKGASEEALRVVAPSLTCRNIQGDRICTANSREISSGLVRGGVVCLSSDEGMISVANGQLRGLSCRVSEVVAEAIMDAYTARFGAPAYDHLRIGAMIVELVEWKAGADYVSITHSNGQAVNGTPVDSLLFSIGTATRLPLSRR